MHIEVSSVGPELLVFQYFIVEDTEDRSDLIYVWPVSVVHNPE